MLVIVYAVVVVGGGVYGIVVCEEVVYEVVVVYEAVGAGGRAVVGHPPRHRL